MVRVKRRLSFGDYLSVLRLVHRYGPRSRRWIFAFSLYVAPLLGLVFTPVCLWAMRYVQSASPAFLLWTFGLFLSLYYLGYPLVFRRKIRKFYRQQELDREWMVEVSEEGVRSLLPGRADATAAWPFFICFAETPRLVVLLEPEHLRFVALPREGVPTAEYEALLGIVRAHLPRAG